MRVGRAATWFLLAAYAGGALVQRATEATPADVLGYAPSAARTAAWLAAGSIALAIANGRERRDDVDGVTALAASFGIGRAALRGARVLAGIVACALAIAIPALGTALVTSALQAGPLEAASALRLVPALGAFALIAGAAIGLTAAVADRMAPERGRSALAALVLIPWMVADAIGMSGASIPGALDAMLTLALRTAGMGSIG
jgi:hypothetical protein